MTEDEAKTKWCPAYRTATSGGDPSSTYEMDNRPRDGIPPDDLSDKDASWAPGPNLNPYACCIGSACMAWRRQTVLIDRATNEPAKPGIAAQGRLEERYSAEGYCGLAGAQT